LTERARRATTSDRTLSESIAEFLRKRWPASQATPESLPPQASVATMRTLAPPALWSDAGSGCLWRPPAPGGYPTGNAAARRPALRPLRTLLYVEDDAKFRAMIRTLLTADASVRVYDCGSGAEGLELARLKCPDLILLDYRMPGLNGGETLLRLRALEETAHIPVIFMTALGLEPEILRYAPHGMIGVIEKPVRSERLLRDIRALWDAHVAAADARSDAHERSC
jgi:CheY-like chemotaxis protein